MRKDVTVHMVVKNEDRFIWYAISSVLPYVDKIFICDTGSQDSTINILSSFNDKKIVLDKKNVQYLSDIGKIRQFQIEQTATEWIWVVDGDEIYTDGLCQEIGKIIEKKGDELEGIVVRRYDLLGDVYHFQDETAGKYRLFGQSGHFALRLINKKKISGLHIEGIYPYEGYYDYKGEELIYHPSIKYMFTEGHLFHAMYLSRSTLGKNLEETFHRQKFKMEKGNKITGKKSIPEVFFRNHPKIVPDVLGKRSVDYEIMAEFLTPLKKVKRKIWKNKV